MFKDLRTIHFSTFLLRFPMKYIKNWKKDHTGTSMCLHRYWSVEAFFFQKFSYTQGTCDRCSKTEKFFFSYGDFSEHMKLTSLCGVSLKRQVGTSKQGQASRVFFSHLSTLRYGQLKLLLLPKQSNSRPYFQKVGFKT